MVRVAVRRGGRKRPNAKGIVYGEPAEAFLFLLLSGSRIRRIWVKSQRRRF
ncbi:unnamed protein product, partial [Laminaria digitata]